MLTLSEAAARLGVTAATLRWQIHNGKLKARKVGPLWVVSEKEVERYGRESRRGSAREAAPKCVGSRFSG